MNTKKAKDDFLEAYKAKGLNISEACKAAGINRGTYYKWRKQREFSDKCEEIEEAFKDWVESQLVKKMKEGDNTMLIFYSKTKLKDRGYIEKQEIAHSSDTPLKIELIEEKRDE